MAWIGIGPATLLPALEPLRAAHARHGPARLLAGGRDALAALTASGDASAVLLLEPGQPASPGHGLGGAWIEGGTGAGTLLGRLPLAGDALTAYVARAVALMARTAPQDGSRVNGAARFDAAPAGMPADHGMPAAGGLPGEPWPLVLLGPREDRYLAVLASVEVVLAPATHLHCLRWSAERIRRAPLLDALRLGAGVLLYHGHGHRQGWHAYGGLGAAEFASGGPWTWAETASVLLSLSCATAGAGFAQALLEQGVAGAVVAPAGTTLHADNVRLARAVAAALAGSVSDLAGLLAAVRAAGCCLAGFDLLGDPALPLAGSAGAVARGAAVAAPAADALLPVLS